MLSVISAFQKILNTVNTPAISGDFAAQFALRRFVKKFEIPDQSASEERKLKTFDQWREYDQNLQRIHLPDPIWYRARLEIHKVLRDFRLGELALTGGSQSEPLRGMQAIADKLMTHDWEVSPDCVELFVKLALRDQAFIRAAKKRARRSLGDVEYLRTVKRIYRLRRSKDDVISYLLRHQLVAREASRYSTVRKNNDIDRSIDLQPFINMVVQRSIGLGVKEVIKRHFDIRLEDAQPVHGRLITDLAQATIDLKNASDSNTWSLVDFLCPKWFVSLLRQAVPPYTEGLDGHYYVTNKVSSMGNGFTFELMTLTLLAASRQLDPDSSVFGDDIIIRASVAERFIKALGTAGWITNASKTFVTGPFRESCGYNFHQEHGYIRSYDFEYPHTFGDCVTFLNKASLLSEIPFFDELRRLLMRAVPTALRGPWPLRQSVGLSREEDEVLDSYFWDRKFKCNQNPLFESYAKSVNAQKWGTFSTYVYKPEIRFARRKIISPSRHYLLYLTYMHSGRQADIVLTGRGDWVKVGMFTDGNLAYRAKGLVTS